MLKESIFNKLCQSKQKSAYRRMQIHSYLSPCTKLKSKWITCLNIKLDILDLVEKKVWTSFEHTGTRDNFLNRTLIPQGLKLTINKQNLMMPNSFCKAKDTINNTKWQPIEWENISTNSIVDSANIQNIQRTQETRHQQTK